MKSFAIAVLLALGTSLPAEARTRTIAPPGNSGVNQYVESIPTANGSQPTNTVHPGGGSHGSGGGPAGGGPAGGGPGGGGAAGGGTGGGAGATGGAPAPGGAIAPSTTRALAAAGPDGVAAAALARATAPIQATAPNQRRQPYSQHGGGTGVPMSAAAGGARSRPTDANGARSKTSQQDQAGSTPATTLARALTGSTGTGGLGALLPMILVASFLGGGVLALLRRRKST